MWDLNCKNPVYKLDVQNGISAFVGENFVVSANTLLKLYDARYPTGPYKSLLVPYNEYRKIASTDKYFCISSTNTHHVYNLQGELIHSLKTERNSFASLSPDSKYFMCSSGSFLFCTDIGSKKRVSTLQEEDTTFGMVDFNPRYAQLATSFFDLNLWLPQMSEIEAQLKRA